MKETQLLKGVLEGCVLDMIGQKERYGYELGYCDCGGNVDFAYWSISHY